MQDFADAAVSGKLKMVYVKSGSATIEDGEDSADISAGQMVMIDDKGETRWSKISEEGLVLLSCETVLAEEGAATNYFERHQGNLFFENDFWTYEKYRSKSNKFTFQFPKDSATIFSGLTAMALAIGGSLLF